MQSYQFPSSLDKHNVMGLWQIFIENNMIAVCDCKNVNNCDSAGIALLIEIHNNTKINLINFSGAILNLFKLYHIHL